MYGDGDGVGANISTPQDLIHPPINIPCSYSFFDAAVKSDLFIHSLGRLFVSVLMTLAPSITIRFAAKGAEEEEKEMESKEIESKETESKETVGPKKKRKALPSVVIEQFGVGL